MQSLMEKKQRLVFFWLTAAVAVSVFFTTSMAHAQTDATRTYVVLGTSQAHQDDMVSAGRHAIADSLISAMGLAVNDLMPSGQAVDHFTALNHMIYSKSDLFILNYNMLAESRLDQRVTMLVRVSVALDKIRDQLQRAGLIVDRMELPGILFMISERIDDDIPRYWWGDADGGIGEAEAEMRSPFLARGHAILERSGFSPAGIEEDGEERADDPVPEPDNATVAGIGRMLNADIVIAGNAQVEKTLSRMGEGMHTVRATVQVRAVSVESGEELGSATHSDVRLHEEVETGVRLAVRGAATQAGEDLARQLSGIWLKRHREQPTQVRILVKGTSSLAHFVKFRERITAMRGVNQLKVMELQANQALLSVNFEFSARRLAKDLMMQTFDAFGIDITDIAEDQMQITLNPR